MIVTLWEYQRGKIALDTDNIISLQQEKGGRTTITTAAGLTGLVRQHTVSHSFGWVTQMWKKAREEEQRRI